MQDLRFSHWRCGGGGSGDGGGEVSGVPGYDAMSIGE